MYPFSTAQPLSSEQLDLLTDLLATRFDVVCEHLAETDDAGLPATDYRDEAAALHAAVAAAARWSRVPPGYHAAFARTIHLAQRMRRAAGASREAVERAVRLHVPAEFVAHVMGEIYALGDAPAGDDLAAPATPTRPRAEAA